jgi:sterol desaturase/sphingolipid hydroxylase (fatty acid hydroxylase superfamily)
VAALDAWLAAHAGQVQCGALLCAFTLFAAIETLAPHAHAERARRSRWGANFGLTALNAITLSALPVAGVTAAQWAAERPLGVLNVLPTPAETAFVLGLLARSWASWATHILMHKVPLLWRLHRVHHSDEFFDVSTTGRFHPLEFVAAAPFSISAVLMFGIPPASIVACDLLNGCLSVFHHSNVRVPAKIDRLLRWIIVTPDMHRIHHSSRQAETDSNFGAEIPLWDHLFGTYRATAWGCGDLGLKAFRGVESRSLRALLANPFR